MQDQPDKVALLNAVAKFLVDPALRAAIQDPALSFRVKIATHLIETVAREITAEPAQDAAERERLETLLGATGSGSTSELNAALAHRLRAGGEALPFLTATHGHLKSTLLDKLSVTNPRFDTSADIE